MAIQVYARVNLIRAIQKVSKFSILDKKLLSFLSMIMFLKTPAEDTSSFIARDSKNFPSLE